MSQCYSSKMNPDDYEDLLRQVEDVSLGREEGQGYGSLKNFYEWALAGLELRSESDLSYEEVLQWLDVMPSISFSVRVSSGKSTFYVRPFELEVPMDEDFMMGVQNSISLQLAVDVALFLGYLGFEVPQSPGNLDDLEETREAIRFRNFESDMMWMEEGITKNVRIFMSTMVPIISLFVANE